MTIEHRPKNKRALIIGFSVALIGLGVLIFLTAPEKNKEVACTMEAKICPDGSAVGRSGPDCEFSECPQLEIDSSWSSFSDPLLAMSFRYPEKLPAEYISVVDWPPVVRNIDEPFSCSDSGSEIDRAGISETRIINDHTYCVTRESEGAAGSVYTNYAYETVKSNETIVLTFSTRSVQCLNYDDPEQTKCIKERGEFNIDIIADKMMSSLLIGNNIR